MQPDPGPDAKGSHNLFVVEPRGWYAMMSLHAPAMRPKLVDCDPIEVDWHSWIAQLVPNPPPVSVSCLERICAWIGFDEFCEFNQYANMMLSTLAVNCGIRPNGNVVFTGYDPVLDLVTGLDADQFAALAAAYRRAAQRISPLLYGVDAEPAGA
jgi:hypothetical protein